MWILIQVFTTLSESCHPWAPAPFLVNEGALCRQAWHPHSLGALSSCWASGTFVTTAFCWGQPAQEM